MTSLRKMLGRLKHCGAAVRRLGAIERNLRELNKRISLGWLLALDKVGHQVRAGVPIRLANRR